MFSGLENFPSPSVCSVSVVLFRLFGSAEHAGRSESRVRNRGCEIGLRQAERPSPPVCSVSVVLFRLFRSAEHAGRSKSRVRNRGFEIGLRRAERPSPPVYSVSVVLFRLFRSAEHARRSKSGCEIGLRQAERPSPPVCSVSVVCSGSSGWLDTRGGQNRAAKSSFGVRNVFRNGKLPLIISLFII